VKYKKFKGKAFFYVKLTTSKKGQYILFTKKFYQHVKLEQGKKKKTATVLQSKPPFELEVWQMFDGSLGRPGRKALFAAEKLEMTVSSTTVRTDTTQPIRMMLSGLFTHSKSDSPYNSLNREARQISFKGTWNDLAVREFGVVLTPVHWDVPEPPEGFLEVLEKIGK
jgi:hypothetical protein